MKLIILLIFASFGNVFATVPHIFNSKQLINISDFNENFLFLKNKALNTYQVVDIKTNYDGIFLNKEIINENIDSINNLKTIEEVNLIEKFYSGQEVNFTLVNDAFDKMENKIEKSYGRSCLELLTNNPNLLNQDGIYKIADSTGTLYQAYCDMTTSGGGWTLLFSPDSTNEYTINSPKLTAETTLKGNDERVVLKSVFGHNMTLTEQQKAVKNVKFTQLNMYGYGLTSTTKSSFAEKYLNLTPWDFNSTINGLAKCSATSSFNKWNGSNTGQHTHNQAILGCYLGEAPYYDQKIVGLGIYTAPYSAYSCGRDGGGGWKELFATQNMPYYCGRWYLMGQSFHRGGSLYNLTNNKNHMVWGR